MNHRSVTAKTESDRAKNKLAGRDSRRDALAKLGIVSLALVAPQITTIDLAWGGESPSANDKTGSDPCDMPKSPACRSRRSSSRSSRSS